MRVNIITRGQTVTPRIGKYSRETGYVRSMFFMADSERSGYYCRVRFRSAIGLQTYRLEDLKPCVA